MIHAFMWNEPDWNLNLVPISHSDLLSCYQLQHLHIHKTYYAKCQFCLSKEKINYLQTSLKTILNETAGFPFAKKGKKNGKENVCAHTHTIPTYNTIFMTLIGSKFTWTLLEYYTPLFWTNNNLQVIKIRIFRQFLCTKKS